MIVRFALIAAGIGLLALDPAPPGLEVHAAARSLQPGELVVLTVSAASPISTLHARAFNHDLRPFSVDRTTWRVLVGIDLTVEPGSYAVTIDGVTGGALQHTTHALVVQPKAFPTRTLTVDDAFVNPPETVQARIADEARLLAELWTSGASTMLWTGAFIKPVPEPPNSAYGSRSVFNGQARSPHTGADFPSPAGTPIKAPNAGRVVLARDLYFTGNTVIIDHGLGVFSLLAHMSAIDVHEGDRVTIGMVVGRVGATGRVTGPHLHWTVRVGDARVDPMSVLAVLS